MPQQQADGQEPVSRKRLGDGRRQAALRAHTTAPVPRRQRRRRDRAAADGRQVDLRRRARSDLRDDLAGAARTACRRSAGTSRRSRSGSSSPTCSRCPARSQATAAPGAQRRSDGGAAGIAAVAAGARADAATADAATSSRSSIPPASRQHVSAISWWVDVLDLRCRSGWLSRSRRADRDRPRPPRAVATATDVADRPAASAIAGRHQPRALIATAVFRASSTGRALDTLRIPGRAAHPGHRQPVVVGRPVRQRDPVAPRHDRQRDPHPGRPRRSRFDLLSTDVIHSLWIPNLQGKIDLVPGRLNELWLQADRAGVYRGQCAEFCGLQHAKMALVVVAEPPDDFERWLTGESRAGAGRRRRPSSSAARTSSSAGPARCATPSPARSAGGRTAPDLTHIASRSTLGAGTLPNTPRPPGRMDRRSARNQAGQPHAADRPDRRRAAGGARLPGDAEMSAATRRRGSVETTRASNRMRWRGSAGDARRDLGEPPPGCVGWLSEVDHKAIGRRFIVTAFGFFTLGRHPRRADAHPARASREHAS